MCFWHLILRYTISASITFLHDFTSCNVLNICLNKKLCFFSVFELELLDDYLVQQIQNKGVFWKRLIKFNSKSWQFFYYTFWNNLFICGNKEMSIVAHSPGWHQWPNMMSMTWHGMVTMIHTPHGVITTWSWHTFMEDSMNNHGIAVKEDVMTMPWWPWSLLKRSRDANYPIDFVI